MSISIWISSTLAAHPQRVINLVRVVVAVLHSFLPFCRDVHWQVAYQGLPANGHLTARRKNADQVLGDMWIERGAWRKGHAIQYTQGEIFGDVCGVANPGDR